MAQSTTVCVLWSVYCLVTINKCTSFGVNNCHRKPRSALTNIRSGGNSSSEGDFYVEIFLENTDAFGIVYNANYLTFYQRALEETLFPFSFGEKNDKIRCSSSSRRPFLVIERCDNLKYSQSAALGDRLRVVSCLKHVITEGNNGSNGESILSVWDQTCTRSSDGTVVNSVTSWVRVFGGSDNVKDGSGNVVVPSLLSGAPRIPTAAKNNDASTQRREPHGERITSEPFRVYVDECQPLGYDNNDDTCRYGVGLVSALRYFERSRTLYYGGPSDLHRMSEEDGRAVVVAKIDDLVLHCRSKLTAAATFGDRVVVENRVRFRGKSLITFYHRLYLLPNDDDDHRHQVDDEPGDGTTPDESLEVIAEATCVLACVDKTSGRAVPFPDRPPLSSKE